MSGSRSLLAGALGLLLAVQAVAQVRLETRSDGTRVIHNRGRRAGLSSSSSPRPALRRSLSRLALEEIVGRYSSDQRLDPDLVLAVIEVESSFDPAALSSKGAKGLMQLMPRTARDLGVTDPYDPAENVRGRCAYLRRMLDTFGGSLELALAGYDAGPRVVQRFGGVPPYRETRGYVEKVLRRYRGDAGYSLPESGLRYGRRTYLSRDAQGRILITTRAPTR